MAQIISTPTPEYYKISKWLGVNENPDGDTKLKLGEAAEMINFKITVDGNLQLRPGTQTVFDFASPIRGMWRGMVGDRRVTVCAAGGKLFEIDYVNLIEVEIGDIADSDCEFFGFSKKLYILNETEYKVWDGTSPLSDVAGYRPLVSVTNLPSGGGTILEGVNKLTGAKRARFSPDGTAKTFTLPESGISSVDYVKNLVTGDSITHTANLAAGTVTFTTAPVQGVDSIEIGWTHSSSDREKILRMRFYEFFSGTTDSRVFLYGDGSNTAVYSGIDYDGKPNCEYFPDLNLLDVGSANVPITGMIRHFSRLLVFKEDSAFSVSYGTITSNDGRVSAAFFSVPINRDIGNSIPGQVRLVGNNPRTIHGTSVYEWRSTSGLLGVDERTAVRISGRVQKSLAASDLASLKAFDDEERREYYLFTGDKCIVHNYDEDCWYIYDQFPARCFLAEGSELFIGTSDGRIMRVSREFRNDDGERIKALWRSGSVAFGGDWRNKNSPYLFITIKPESGAHVTVGARTNRGGGGDPIGTVSCGLSTYSHFDYRHFSYRTNRQAQPRRLKIRLKRFAFGEIFFESDSLSATCTILSCSIPISYIGNVKQR